MDRNIYVPTLQSNTGVQGTPQGTKMLDQALIKTDTLLPTA